MAQLSEDSFAFGGELMALDEAVAAFRARLTAVPETEEVPLGAAVGRVLAGDLRAPLAIPSFDNSAVDGYAVRIADVPEGGATLRVIARVIAGQDAATPIVPGTAIRVFTGAPLPPGADTVYMQEDVRREGDAVTVPPGLKRGANARFVGEDLGLGDIALAAGRRLRPEDLGLAAALGVAQLRVRRRLRVAVASTGNEIAEPGRALSRAALYDANRFILGGLIARTGAELVDCGILRDDPEALRDGLLGASTHADVVVTSGGVSTGEEDHVKAALEAVGRLDWWRIGIKPGRPVAMGVIGGAAVLGLPGNPVAVYVTFTQIVRPLIAALSGETWRKPRPIPVASGFAYKKKAGRREFVRVRLEERAGCLIALKYPQDGAGVITSLTRSDGFVELPEDLTKVVEGDLVGFVAFSALD